ncbi:MAG: hypothetical protein QXR81_07395 [Candidatus Nezhaarchaeales archaeon]
MIGYDGFKHRKASKIYVCVDENSMPLSIALGLGNGHNSKRIDELLDGLEGLRKSFTLTQHMILKQ